MRKNKILSLALLAVMALSVGCSDNKPVNSTGESSSASSDSASQISLEGIAQNEISVSIAEEANTNNTVFRLNKIIDAGTVEEGNPNHYIYLDVTISNPTEKEYDLSVLNNFYILADGNEIHFDIKTQLYAIKSIGNYSSSPFTVPANNEFSGTIGGFMLPEDAQEVTVCFFPTQDDKSDKSNVIKVTVPVQDIESLS